jgi:cation diffusion facilitator CzcD-associated flavoprotein CzcO
MVAPQPDSPEEIEAFKDPAKLHAYRQQLESANNALFKNLVFQETCQELKKEFRSGIEKVMKERLAQNPSLFERMLPDFQPWCRRLTPGDDYLVAIQQPNAKLVDSTIETITSTGLRMADGETEDVDIIITATGFVNSRIFPWSMTGKEGQTLASLWKEDADGYLSICAPSMPNFFTIGCGPNFTIANGSVLSSFGFTSDYVTRWVRKMATEDIKCVVARDEAVQAYNIYIQEVLRRTAWNDDCRSWYRKGRVDEYRTGITAIYPGSMMHYRSMLEELRGEDFEITYRSANRFRFYGNGLTALDMSENPNLAFYLQDTMKFENMI